MLTVAQIEATPAPDLGKKTTLYDGAGSGLYLLVEPNGSKGWRLKYKKLSGAASTKSFGTFPDVPPEVARERCKAFRDALTRGEDPVALERAGRDAALQAAVNTFGRIGAEYLRHDDTLSIKTKAGHVRYFNHLKKFHGRPLDSITTKELVDACRVLETKGNRETAHRVASFADRVYRYAAQSGLTNHNPAGSMRGALKPVLTENRAGITDPKKFGELMRLIDGDDYSKLPVRHALRLLARTFVRPGELRMAAWADMYDLDGAAPEWRIPADVMKMDRPHTVPLSPACVAILKAQREIAPDSQYVFPGERAGRVMSDGTMNAALKTLFYSSAEHVPHGFRTSASTLLNELGYDFRLVDLMLAHKNKDQVEAAYNKAELKAKRREIMVRWSEYIQELKG